MAKLTKTDFKKGFTFSQVVRFAYDAPFSRSIALYTRDFQIIEDIFSADRDSISQFSGILDASLALVAAARGKLADETSGVHFDSEPGAAGANLQ